jgi:hypothetical protein
VRQVRGKRSRLLESGCQEGAGAPNSQLATFLPQTFTTIYPTLQHQPYLKNSNWPKHCLG